ncbi:hypothetical protein H0H81_011872 [Sphagnurus paluster]|uniref:Aminoglycoside phosphotransferase domain-containing protein n=1 Tax=Sphagnurus paluster TaxID=117069 RepID=A0A9P7GI92_9AGAR|nr:hypothetical protein H0H81_011872 [Sphagnurus paluster]
MSSSSSIKSEWMLVAETISIPALQELASRHAYPQEPPLAPAPITVHTPPLWGAYNLAYPITLPDGRKWLARIPFPEYFDQPSMESAMCTLRLICEKTTIPIPTIHAYDTSSENALGAPYILMDFAEGVSLDSVWLDIDDDARRRIFEQIAGHMSQLGRFEFDKIGALCYDEASRTYSVGPCRRQQLVNCSSDADMPVETRPMEDLGPFDTAHGFFAHLVQSFVGTFAPAEKPFAYLTRMLALSLPDPAYDGPPFVLSHPDFNPQNILVDPVTFEVTAFIDWDGVQVGPRHGDFARCPTWITKDWDPALYQWVAPRAMDALPPGSSNAFGNEELMDNMSGSHASDPDVDTSGSSSSSVKTQSETDADSEKSGVEEPVVPCTVAGKDATEASCPQPIDSSDSETSESPLTSSSSGISTSSSSESGISSLSTSSEESPETLRRHRELYASIYAGIDPQNADITRQSHIYEALHIALHNPFPLAHGIVTKLRNEWIKMAEEKDTR